MHPQDELSRIKMRNRRYMNACVQENSLMNVPMFGGGGPYMRGMPMNAPMGPSSTIDYEMAQDELAVSASLNWIHAEVPSVYMRILNCR